ncbi:MAG: ABC transporter permease [Verrucomicrobiota bacterium]|jgi:ABC-type transport system involved in multi-copper enzyme maturation permease subunit
MNVLPVIERELRASARQPFTYYLRVLGVTALLLAGLLFGLEQGFAPGFGRQLFGRLHCALFGAIWVLVPMLTADCISRERREGTLGLLFLTPLKGTDIVVAKVLAQGLRAMTLGLAVLPVLTIPFLLGGVSWADAVRSVIVNANAMCWALAAGLLASAWNKAWLRALLWAGILAAAFFLILAAAVDWFLLQALNAIIQKRPGQFEMNWDSVLETGFLLANTLMDWPGWAPVSLGAPLGKTTICSLVALVAAVLAAGAKTRRSWQEEPPSRRRVWLRQTFCTPVLWLSFFRWWMRRKVERNPIGWLEQRTWSGRLVTWGCFAVLISIYSTVLTDRYFFRDANHLQETLAWLLAGSMAMSAAGSFRRERESGVLELLLVSPLGEHRIISGRLRGLWGQFLPTAGLLLAVWPYFSSFLPGGSDAGAIVFFAVTFLSVPVFGLYFSLRCRNFLTAFLSTVAVGLLLPMVLSALFEWVRWAYANSNSRFSWEMRLCVSAAIYQAILASFCWHRLYRRLKKRAFPLERTEA